MRKSLWRAIAVTLLVALANIGLWAFLNRPAHIADWRGDIGGLAYNPSQRYQDPTKLIFPSEAELDGDIRLLSRYTKRLRTYLVREPADPAPGALLRHAGDGRRMDRRPRRAQRA